MISIFLPVIVILLFAIPVIMYFRFSKTKRTLGLAKLLGVIHFCFVALFAVLIYFGMKQDAEVAMIWMLFYIIDIPVSLFLPYLDNLVTKAIGDNFMLANFYIPFMYFSLFGSIQYFFIGRVMGWVYNKLTEKNKGPE